jgi:hypothetical protein
MNNGVWGDPIHWLLLVFGLSIGVFFLFLFWWFVSRLEHKISLLVSRELAAITAQISAFREDAIAEARLAVNSARTSHTLLLRVEKNVENLDQRVLKLEYPSAGPKSGGGPVRP